MTETPLVFDSVTHLTTELAGSVSVCASHGGRYCGIYAARMGTAGIVLCDASVGRDRAGIGALDVLQDLGVPAAVISHTSARIGDGRDCYFNGRISHMNRAAYEIGIEPGASASDTYAMMVIHSLGNRLHTVPDMDEARIEAVLEGYPAARLVITDSNGLILPSDAGAIVVSGSHGGLLGGRPETAAKADVSALVCNDAGKGKDDAGVTRLPALQAKGIAAACVSAESARIGEGRSTYEDGIISAVNAAAEQRGGRVGQSCRDFVVAMAQTMG
ncbi:MAG: hypothetical protein ACFCUN_07505 [Hyphomicrobiaceae bacterium]